MIWLILLYLVITPFTASACAVLISKSFGNGKIKPLVLISSVVAWPVLIVCYVVALILYYAYSVVAGIINRWISWLNEKF